jgi:hypothetical protein
VDGYRSSSSRDLRPSRHPPKEQIGRATGTPNSGLYAPMQSLVKETIRVDCTSVKLMLSVFMHYDSILDLQIEPYVDLVSQSTLESHFPFPEVSVNDQQS